VTHILHADPKRIQDALLQGKVVLIAHDTHRFKVDRRKVELVEKCYCHSSSHS